MKKPILIFCLVLLVSTSAFASLANPFLNDIENNPAKLFFRDESLFIGEITFRDTFLESSNSNPIFKHPNTDLNVLILGGLFSLKLGVEVDMSAEGPLYMYDSVMTRYMNVAFALGYKIFSFGAGLTLSDKRIKEVTFNDRIPFLSFLYESYFTSYQDLPGSTDSYLNLSLMLSDKEYFAVSVNSPNFFRFNTTSPVFDATALYKKLNFSVFLKTPDYNKNDDLNIVVGSLTLDGVGLLGDEKKLALDAVVSLVLSPEMRLSLFNYLNFTFLPKTRYTFSDSEFLHTLGLEFISRRFALTWAFELPPSLYRGENSYFSSYIRANIML